MTIDKYYSDITKLVYDFCDRHKLQLLDIFLVGSRVHGNKVMQNKNADYDSVIIIQDNLGLENLKEIRDDLQDEINVIDKLDLYHFKFFSRNEFDKAKHYDSFRIFEFYLSNRSLRGTTLLNNNSISLDEFNFINSILLQEVNEAFTSLRTLKNISENEKVKKRVERNIQILYNKKIKPFCSQDNFVEYCKSKDHLYKHFKEIKHSKNDFRDFIKKYFSRFRHEFINRAKIYSDNINKLFDYA